MSWNMYGLIKWVYEWKGEEKIWIAESVMIMMMFVWVSLLILYHDKEIYLSIYLWMMKINKSKSDYILQTYPLVWQYLLYSIDEQGLYLFVVGSLWCGSSWFYHTLQGYFPGNRALPSCYWCNPEEHGKINYMNSQRSDTTTIMARQKPFSYFMRSTEHSWCLAVGVLQRIYKKDHIAQSLNKKSCILTVTLYSIPCYIIFNYDMWRIYSTVSLLSSRM